MKRISIDNGHTYYAPAEVSDIMPDINRRDLWDVIVAVMDDETREAVHMELAPCTDAEFLTRYLELAPADLIIG